MGQFLDPSESQLEFHDSPEISNHKNKTGTSEERIDARTQGLLAAIVESSDDAIISKDLEGKILSWNCGAQRLFGYHASEIVGQSIKLLVPPEGLARETDILNGLRRGERVDHYETIRMAKDGRSIDVSVTISPLRDIEGNIYGASTIARDISHRKRNEDRLRELAAALSEAGRRKDEFLATLAHELRNPLAPIRNGLNIIRLAGNNGTIIEQTRLQMERQLDQTVRLVDDLLDVSRINQGKIELRPERVELAPLIDNAIFTSRSHFELGYPELHVQHLSSPVFINGDATRLEQIFVNLLNNAAKFSQQNATIHLTVEQDGNDVIVSIKDNGIGISSKVLPDIFKIFVQAEQPLDKTHGGLGIGLSLVKRLTEMHGGSVKVRSEGLGLGSEFFVRLPVASTTVAKLVTNPTDAQASPARFRILIADDNEGSVLTLSMLLELMGNEVCTAKDGLQAVQVASTFRPDIAILDIGMPKMNGLEACREIRKQSWGDKVMIVALTGWSQEEDKRRSYEAGFDRHEVKPINMGVIESLLNGVAMKRGQG